MSKILTIKYKKWYMSKNIGHMPFFYNLNCYQVRKQNLKNMASLSASFIYMENLKIFKSL